MLWRARRRMHLLQHELSPTSGIEGTRIEADAITDTMKHYRDKHLESFAQQEAPFSSLVFTDSLTAYRRIRSHGLNIAQTLAGEK